MSEPLLDPSKPFSADNPYTRAWSDHTIDEGSNYSNSSPIVLLWNGSDYVPSALKSFTGRPKEFRGTTDPHTVTGVVLSVNDTWISS